MADYVRISDDLRRPVAWLAELAELGPAEIIVHHVAGDQTAFVEAFGRDEVAVKRNFVRRKSRGHSALE